MLKEIHSLFAMFHGTIRAMLEKEPSGELVRRHLYSFIMDYLRGKYPCKKKPIKYISTIFHLCYDSKYFIVSRNCQHVKSGLHGIIAAVVMVKLLYQMVSLDLCCLSDAEVVVSFTLIMNFSLRQIFLWGKNFFYHHSVTA